MHKVGVHRPDARPIQAAWLSMKPAGRVGAIRELLTILDDAAEMYYREGALTLVGDVRRNAAPPKLLAMQLAAYSLLRFLERIDHSPGSAKDLRHHVVSELNLALTDYIEGRESPDWFRPYKDLNRRGSDSLIIWYGRAQAAATLRQLLDMKVSRLDAEAIVFRVVKDRGLGELGLATMYRWLRAMNRNTRQEDRAPALVAERYSRILDALGQLKPSCNDTQGLTEFYAADLDNCLRYLGFFVRKSTSSDRSTSRAYR
jgi:hypothetical protein